MFLQHFILTRFNLLLWQNDKEGHRVRTIRWLEQRFSLFEHYCLPSVINQSRQDFKWIVLFDSMTPAKYESKIKDYQKQCPQLIPVFVKPEDGRYFAELFKTEIVKRIDQSGKARIITTYLDNDDALHVKFVENLQNKITSLDDGTFIYYSDGYQFFTDYHYLLQIRYPRNHFVSVVEYGDPSTIRGVFGYGGHYHIDEIKGVKIERIKDVPMWCEVIHNKNMVNDAYFLFGTKMIGDKEKMRNAFAVNETVKSGLGIYVCRFLPRYIRTFIRRTKHYLSGKKW
jgi:hypothetical protein